jgi:L-ascorbate metabolism protein UlaG (beta-lactamase superfamily)
MKITFYAHASFRLEDSERIIITDPYTPGPSVSGFDPIGEPADIVIMSSATDRFHSDPSHVTGTPEVVNALELPPEGKVVKGLAIKSYPAMESTTFDYGRDPDANAMYHFTVGGLRFLHMGDIGNPVSDAHLDALAGEVDVLLALTGEHATIALSDLDKAIGRIGPRAVIPMHYYSPRGVLKIEPVESFLERLPTESVTYVASSEFELSEDMLPPRNSAPRIFVMQQSR